MLLQSFIWSMSILRPNPKFRLSKKLHLKLKYAYNQTELQYLHFISLDNNFNLFDSLWVLE